MDEFNCTQTVTVPLDDCAPDWNTAPGIGIATSLGMTRIGSTNAQNYRPFRRPGSGRPTGHSTQRVTTTRAELVNNTPIEEVIFEPNSDVDQRARHRGYVITEPVEVDLVECKAPGAPQEHFWQGFSAPFMAQVIGQHVAGPDPRIRSYATTGTCIARPSRHRLSTAC